MKIVLIPIVLAKYGLWALPTLLLLLLLLLLQVNLLILHWEEGSSGYLLFSGSMRSSVSHDVQYFR